MGNGPFSVPGGVSGSGGNPFDPSQVGNQIVYDYMQDPNLNRPAGGGNPGFLQSDMGTPRGTNLMDIPGNIALDIGDMGQGINAIGSFVKDRAFGTFYGQSPIRPDDLEGVQKITSGIVDHYMTNWINPIAQGNFGHIATHLTQHPLDIFDVAPLPPLKALKIGKMMSRIPGASQLQQAGKVFGQALSENEFTKPAAELVKKTALQGNLKNEIATMTADEYQAFRALVDEKIKGVPTADRAELMALMDGSSPRYWQQGFIFDRDIHPATRDFIETVRPYVAEQTNKLTELGGVTREQAFKDRWLPAVAAAAQVFQLTDAELKELMKNPSAMMAVIKDAKAYLNRRGVEPIYVGRMTDAAKRNVLARPYQLPDHALRVAADKARAAAEGEIPTQRTSMEYARSRMDKASHFSDDARGVTLARYAQVLQLFNATRALLNRMIDAQVNVAGLTERQIVEKGLVPFHAKEFLGKIGGGMGAFTDNELATITGNVLADKIYLPKWMVESFENLTSPKSGRLEKTLAGFANFARRYVLGFNFSLPEWQLGQTLVMLGVTQFRGPRDTIVSFLSYALTLDEKARNLIPKQLLGEQFVSDSTSATLLPGKAGRAIEKVIDFNFGRLEKYDRAVRYVAAGYYALKLSEKFPELGGPIRGMLTTGEALERMKNVFSSAEHTSQVNKDILLTLGDYTALQSEKRAMLRTTLLWWNWIEAITKHVAMLPDKHPFKFAMMQRIAWISRDMVDPNLPSMMQQSGAVRASGDATNPDGIPYYIMGGSVNPYSAVAELAEQIGQPIKGEESSNILGQMNPVFPIMAAAFFAFNPGTGEEFHNPNLISYHGKQFKPEDLMRGEYKDQKPRPNIIEFAARTFFPTPTRLAERLYAKATTGGEPSAFTTLGVDPAPRTQFNSGGQPIQATSLQEIALETLTGVRRIPIDVEGGQRMEQLQQRSIRKILKSGKKQLSPDKLEGYISNE